MAAKHGSEIMKTVKAANMLTAILASGAVLLAATGGASAKLREVKVGEVKNESGVKQPVSCKVKFADGSSPCATPGPTKKKEKHHHHHHKHHHQE
ncbi:MAG TPA: hypothetical protein VHN11_20135 [Xanthobacteraceae bacterium]|jgi:hypothetical protein|nr:hypothetical protein [Xanthobacteraceae bacterium]